MVFAHFLIVIFSHFLSDHVTHNKLWKDARESEYICFATEDSFGWPDIGRAGGEISHFKFAYTHTPTNSSFPRKTP